jgi:hypothetical protein
MTYSDKILDNIKKKKLAESLMKPDTPLRGSLTETEEVVRTPSMTQGGEWNLNAHKAMAQEDLARQKMNMQSQIDAAQDKYNVSDALYKGQKAARDRTKEFKNQGFLNNAWDGVSGMLDGVAGYGKKLFNDPARMGLLSTGLSMMDPNTYYDKDGFYSTAGGINRALGKGVNAAQTVQGSPAFKRATELMKIQEWNKSGRGQGEFQRLMNERNKLIAQDPNHPDIATIDDRLEYLVHIKRPSDIDSFEYMDRLPEDKKPSWFANKRNPTTINQNDQTSVLDPSNPTVPSAVFPTNLKPADKLGYIGNRERVEKQNQMMSERITEAQLGLPQAEDNYKYMADLLDTVYNHEGLEQVIGMPNIFTLGGRIPSTAGADFRPYLEQLKGKQFLEAFQSLKGGGQITEIEGNKAQAAIARMDSSQSEPAFRKALMEFKEVIFRAIVRQRTLARQGGEMPQRRATDPNSGGSSLTQKKARLEALKRKQGGR